MLSFVSNKYNQIHPQARKQEFFRAADVSWNEDTSINFLSTTQRKQTPQEKKLDYFLLDALKTPF